MGRVLPTPVLAAGVPFLKWESMKKKDVLEIIIAFSVAWLFYQGLSYAVDTPMPIVSVVSNSMEPVLHRGDMLVVTGSDNLSVGDIVIYDSVYARETIVHRVIEEVEGGYIIKGDNNERPDRGVVSEEQTRRNRLSERRREKVERNKAEKYGVDQSSLGMKIGRSFLQSAGSVLGVRSVWETGKLLSDYYKKKGQRGLSLCLMS